MLQEKLNDDGVDKNKLMDRIFQLEECLSRFANEDNWEYVYEYERNTFIINNRYLYKAQWVGAGDPVDYAKDVLKNG
jgi:hypothetical protein